MISCVELLAFEDLDVVDAIANAPVEANGQGEVSKPVSPVKIESVQISEN